MAIYGMMCTYMYTHTVQPARNLHLNTRHRDLPQRVRWKWPPRSVFLPIFRVVTVNTARRGVRTPRISMAGYGGPLFYTIYMYNVDDKNRWSRWSLAGDHRESSRSVIAIREGHLFYVLDLAFLLCNRHIVHY